jgi:alpha-1,3-rhamnosyl/mannosyltransferase
VICSPVASLPEVGGAAALFTEMKPDAYLKAMRQVSCETGLRNELIERGLAHAVKFSWNKCASEVLEVYRMTLRFS